MQPRNVGTVGKAGYTCVCSSPAMHAQTGGRETCAEGKSCGRGGNTLGRSQKSSTPRSAGTVTPTVETKISRDPVCLSHLNLSQTQGLFRDHAGPSPDSVSTVQTKKAQEPGRLHRRQELPRNVHAAPAWPVCESWEWRVPGAQLQGSRHGRCHSCPAGPPALQYTVNLAR